MENHNIQSRIMYFGLKKFKEIDRHVFYHVDKELEVEKGSKNKEFLRN